MRTVLFDFDKTLTHKDTLRPLAHFLTRENHQYPVGLVPLYFVLLLARFQVIDDKKMKELFLDFFIKGKDLLDVNSMVIKFLKDNLESLLNAKVFDALIRHRDSGNKVFIVSANFDFLLEPLMQLWGIDGVVCTQTQKMQGVFTGKIVGDTCKGANKVKRLKAVFLAQDIANMIAYGDADDKEMLGIVGEAVLI